MIFYLPLAAGIFMMLYVLHLMARLRDCFQEKEKHLASDR